MKRNCFIDLTILVLYLVAICHTVVGKNEYTKLFEKCTNEKNTFNCLKRRALEIFDSAIDDDSVYVLNDFISIGRDPTSLVRSNKGMKIPVLNVTEKSLDEQLDNKFHEYLSSRNIRLTIPGNTFEGIQNNLIISMFVVIFSFLSMQWSFRNIIFNKLIKVINIRNILESMH